MAWNSNVVFECTMFGVTPTINDFRHTSYNEVGNDCPYVSIMKIAIINLNVTRTGYKSFCSILEGCTSNSRIEIKD